MHFCLSITWKVILKKRDQKYITQQYVDTAYLDFFRQELSVRGIGFVVVLLVRRGIDFLCACTGGSIQL